MKRLMLLILTFAGWASAQAPQGFKTPSGNIYCLSYNNELRCDLLSTTTPKPPRPKDCDLDWGNAFTMTVKGKAARICHGDSAMDPSYPVLQYGKTWKKGGYSCTSLTSGLNCTNKDKHGWLLSKSRQVIF